GQARHAPADQLDDVVRTTQEVVAQLADDRGVRRLVDAAVAGGQTPAHLRQHARRPGRVLADALRALANRERLVECGQALLGGLLARERADVVGAVVGHAPDQGESRPRLAGELEVVHLLREPRASVVLRLVLGYQSELAHLRLERGCTLDPRHGLGDGHHLADAGARLG